MFTMFAVAWQQRLARLAGKQAMRMSVVILFCNVRPRRADIRYAGRPARRSPLFRLVASHLFGWRIAGIGQFSILLGKGEMDLLCDLVGRTGRHFALLLFPPAIIAMRMIEGPHTRLLAGPFMDRRRKAGR